MMLIAVVAVAVMMLIAVVAVAMLAIVMLVVVVTLADATRAPIAPRVTVPSSPVGRRVGAEGHVGSGARRRERARGLPCVTLRCAIAQGDRVQRKCRGLPFRARHQGPHRDHDHECTHLPSQLRR